MENNPKQERTTVTLKQETIDLLKTVKSCFQLVRKKDITYDELIKTLINQGLEKVDSKVHKILLISSQEEDEPETETADEETTINDNR